MKRDRGQEFSGGQRQEVSPASFDVRKADMAPDVRGYVENLEGQIQEMMRGFGVKNKEGLQQMIELGQISLEDLEHVVD